MRERKQAKAEGTEEVKEQEQARAEGTEGAKEQEQARAEGTEEVKEQEQAKAEQKHRFRLRGCFAAKAMAVVLIFIGVAMCAAGAVVIYAGVEENMYFNSLDTVLKGTLVSSQANSIAYRLKDALGDGGEEMARWYLEDKNVEAAILKPEDKGILGSSVFVWKSYEDEEALEENGFYSSMYGDVLITFHPSEVSFGGTAITDGAKEAVAVPYIVRVFFDPRFEKQDDLREVAWLIELLYRFRYAAFWLCGGGALLLVSCVIFLLCGAGHKNGREGIVPGLLTGIPFDVMILGMGFGLYVVWRLVLEMQYYFSYYAAAAAMGIAILVLGLLFLWDLAIRLKLGKLWRHTLIFCAARFLKKVVRALWRLIRGIPLVWTAVAAYMAVCLLEILGISRFTRMRSGGWLVWWMEKAVLFALVLYLALICRKLLKASRELAAGHEEYRVDTRPMVGAFLEHGENLNSIGRGVSRAVEEKMKSERLKTELISNVSHDLKTPLTSIINYAELIGREETENAAIQEYAEVLLRQSGRLKRLLENLVEVSKAVTGSMEVNLEPCEAGVLLSQAAGEYQQRMEEKGLELRVSQPEEPVRILADGRHLWRVFDNLLNNICKYAQEGSRVYLTLEQKEGKVFIIFRNMSGYALDISPQELEERFVRGDKSRHMEGNGLGLSIAKSLTELQKGQMNIVIDGDLFKVTLTFTPLQPEAYGRQKDLG